MIVREIFNSSMNGQKFNVANITCLSRLTFCKRRPFCLPKNIPRNVPFDAGVPSEKSKSETTTLQCLRRRQNEIKPSLGHQCNHPSKFGSDPKSGRRVQERATNNALQDHSSHILLSIKNDSTID